MCSSGPEYCYPKCFQGLPESAVEPAAAHHTYRLKVKGWKKIFHANEDQKTAGVATLISDKKTLKQRL